VYLVDDSELVRRRHVDMFCEIEDVEIVGQKGNTEKAETEIRRLSPDVVILDLKLPGRNGIAVTSYRACEYCWGAERDKLSNLGVCVAEREGCRDEVASFPLIDRSGTSPGVDKEQLARRTSLAVSKEG